MLALPLRSVASPALPNSAPPQVLSQFIKYPTMVQNQISHPGTESAEQSLIRFRNPFSWEPDRVQPSRGPSRDLNRGLITKKSPTSVYHTMQNMHKRSPLCLPWVIVVFCSNFKVNKASLVIVLKIFLKPYITVIFVYFSLTPHCIRVVHLRGPEHQISPTCVTVPTTPLQSSCYSATALISDHIVELHQ